MFNDLSSPISLLHTRRSGKPRDLIAPGPDPDQMQQILSAAARVPDHGKLAPWRFIIVDDTQRSILADLLIDAYRAEKPHAGRLELDAMEQFAHQAPTLVVVTSVPARDSKIPLWEQELSAGSACMNLLVATHALGFAGGWLSGWPAYNDRVNAAFTPEGGRIAGFIFIGTPAKDLEERPRPDYNAVVSRWIPEQSLTINKTT